MSRRPTLRAQLLRWLLVPLGVLCFVGTVLVHVTVQRSIDSAYDRSLHASALTIAEHVRWDGQHPAVDVPPAALEMLDTSDQDRIFYGISYQARDQRDVFVTGYSDLPAPPGKPRAGSTIFYEAPYRGEAVRLAAHYIAMPGDEPVLVLVRVAETVAGRRAVAKRIVTSALASELGLIVLGAALVWFAVTRGLEPLARLSRDVARRTASDLAPLRAVDAPDEISPLVAAVDQLMARVREAIGSQRRFIADASHQIRTPLAVLHTQAEVALRSPDLESMQQAVAQLRDHCTSTSHLASQLLSLARAEPATGQRAPREIIDATAVAREACATFVPEALARNVDLGFDAKAPVPIRAQPLVIREIVGNLLDNAIRYAGPGSTVTVSVQQDPPGMVRLSVEDDGPGIALAERTRVLERFYRIPGSPGDGAGLGLSIVREFAVGHGGSVHLLDGSNGRGLRAEVRFPPGAPQ